MENQAYSKLNKQESSNRWKCLLLSGAENCSLKSHSKFEDDLIPSILKWVFAGGGKKIKEEKKKKVYFKQKKVQARYQWQKSWAQRYSKIG